MAPLTQGVARIIPEAAAAAARGAPAVIPIPRLPVIPTEVIYIRLDGVLEQIPLEHIEKRDRRLVIAPSIEQVSVVYTDDLLRTIDRLLMMVQRRQTALATHGIELKPAATAHARPPPAGRRRRRDAVRGRRQADQGRGQYTTSEEEGKEVNVRSSSSSDDSDALPS
ncbi:hypothetical protein CsSME_00023001 [Camellia sinensis var. sinensis]